MAIIEYSILKWLGKLKGKETDCPYEKSRLYTQGHSDQDKNSLLTQSPTIQRASQRVTATLSSSLKARNINLCIRDIRQSYSQPQSSLKRVVYAYLLKEMKAIYNEDTIIRLVKPSYGIEEASLHWFATYFKYHLNNLQKEISTYDPCLLISNSNKQFAVVGIQTDDALILTDMNWSILEETELSNASFKAKEKLKLSRDTPLIFNGCLMYECG